jgi:diacylglycerol kinase (ATP)
MGKRVHFIINPISGRRGRRRRHLDVFMERLSQNGHDVHINYTQGPKDASRLAGEAVDAGADLIGVAGGDGTIHEAVDGLGDADIPVLVVPCGTENVVAKYLGIRLDANRLWDTFEGHHVRPFRMMEANGRKVLFSCGLGLDGAIIRALSARRRGHISYGSYVIPVVSAFLRYRSPNLTVNVDKSDVYSGPGLVLVGKVPRYALGMKALWRADPADEWIDVAIFPRRRGLPLLWDAVRVLVNPRWRSASAVYLKGRAIRVTADSATPMQFDGEYAGEAPVEVVLTSQFVRFVAPTANLPPRAVGPHDAENRI